MPSSTSNSEARRPPWPPGRTWLPALVLALAVLTGWELLWRGRGYQPSIRSGVDLWCQERDRVARAGPRSIVLLGASRCQWGTDPSLLDRLCPGYSVHQLAFGGHYAMPTLRNLAEDERFRGVVVYSLTASWLVPQAFESTQQRLLDYYTTEWNAFRELDRELRTAVQTRLVLTDPGLTLQELALRVREGALLAPQSEVAHPDRSVRLFRKNNPAERQAGRQGNVQWYDFLTRRSAESVSYEQWLGIVENLDEHIRRIQSRSGKAVLLRMPSSGPVRAIEQECFPRERYWDVLAAHTAADGAIHYEDVPAMARLEAADWAHLDASDVPRFTRLLARELRRRGIISAKPSPEARPVAPAAAQR